MTAALPERTWWRRNAVALGLAVALIAATIGVQVAREGRALYDQLPSQAIGASVGETLEFGGAAITVTDVERLYPGGLLRDTAVLRVSVDIAAAPGGALPASCYLTLAESGGSHGERTWTTSNHSSVDILQPEGTTTYCDPEATAPYTIAAPFVVPDDVDGVLTLRVEVGDLAPRHAALELGPLP